MVSQSWKLKALLSHLARYDVSSSLHIYGLQADFDVIGGDGGGWEHRLRAAFPLPVKSGAAANTSKASVRCQISTGSTANHDV